jgi:hypothetical protein
MSNIFVNDVTYQPKGSMCCNCSHWFRDCSHLPFKTMPVIESQGNIRVVKCHEYIKPNDETKSDEQ